MMGRRSPAPNAVVRPVVEYLPDHRGAGMFAALNGQINAGLAGARAVVPTSPTYSGWVKSQQTMHGAQAMLGRARTIAPANSTLNDQKTTADTVAANIFRDRMARGLG